MLKRTFFLVVITFSFGGTCLSHDSPDIVEPLDIERTLTRAEHLSKEWTEPSLNEATSLYRRLRRTFNVSGDRANEAKINLELARTFLVLGERDKAARLLNETIKSARQEKLADLSIAALCEVFFMQLSEGSIVKGANVLAEIEKNYNANRVSAETTALLKAAKAELSYYQHNLQESTALFEVAVDIASSVQSRHLARIRLGLGYSYLADNNYGRCFEVLNSLLESATADGNRRLQVFVRIAIGHALSQIDDKRGAMESYKVAETMFPENGVDMVEKAMLYNGLGKIYEDFGELRTALSYRRRAFASFGSVRHFQGQTITLVNIGVLSGKVGDDEDAERSFRQALTMFHTANDSVGSATVEAELGMFYSSRARHEKALGHFTAARSSFQKTGNKYMLSVVEVGQARIAIMQKRFVEARKHLNASLDLNRELQNRFAEADTLSQLAFVEHLLNETDLAISSITQALKITESLSRSASNSKLGSTYVSTVHERYTFYVEMLMRTGRDSVTRSNALVAAERGRSKSMVEDLALWEIDLNVDADPSDLQKEKELRAALNAKSDKLTGLLGGQPARSEIDPLDSTIRELEHQLEEIKAELKQKSPAYSAIKDPPPFELADFQANVLRDDEVLLEYFLGKDESYLWLAGKDEFEAFVLPGKEGIEGKVDVLREILDARKPREGESFQDHQRRVTEAEAKYVSLARELSNMILGPVADRLAGKRLIVVPDGKLHYFPISALPLPNVSSDDPILLSNEVVYQPSAQTYSLLKKLRKSSKSVNTKDLLVLSDPVFNSADPRLTGIEISESKDPQDHSLRLVESFDSLRRLPASGDEAKSVADAIGGTSDKFSGFEATRERLLNTSLADYRVVHLATHGFVNPDRPELSSIVLSRYDPTGRKIDESIRMQDIYSMKLNADLVVLSACETGTGKEIKGEGVMGLNTAFLQAGARSVVSTLWQVEDNAANHLMKEFYSQMVSDGMSPSAALRAAQIKLYQDPQFRSPFFWAAFTIQGDANTPPNFTRGNARSVIAAGVFAILVIVGFLIWRSRSVQRTSKL